MDGRLDVRNWPAADYTRSLKAAEIQDAEANRR
jgi:hypothetical protein